MDPRARLGITPAERLAAIVRSQMMKMARCSHCSRLAQPNTPDYADFREVLIPWLDIELLKARIAEAKLAGNSKRVKELQAALDSAYLVASKIAGKK